MRNKPKVLVLRTAGTNCDMETAFAFETVGAAPDLAHINQIIAGKKHLRDYEILVLSGGFSYGDDIGAGKILANEMRFRLKDRIKDFLREGRLIIGICNGFQILVKSGFLPGNGALRQEVSLIMNDSGKFEDRWVYLVDSSQITDDRKVPKCVWVRDMPRVIYLPVAHGEGKFVAADAKILERLRKNGQIVFQYCDAGGCPAGYPENPN
ncbi:MAG: phosphoribosylformylglycinamidine synthase subunit PurQ, partial [Candidatus Omnitrophica bacterium]|nr:phosphoribosylformylglycinamidine synthase subunit PurQ [Candidatus Omnitrophota bacterium]